MADRGIFRITDDHLYRQWIGEFDTIKPAQRAFIEDRINALPAPPHIAVVPLASRGLSQRDLAIFKRGLEAQAYRNWHLVLSHDADGLGQPIVSSAAAGSCNLILEAAETADFVLPLPLDAVLPTHALAKLVLALTVAPDAEIVYADEDILRHGKRSQPHFKTDWDPFFILGSNYVGLPVLYRSEALRRSRLQGLTSTTVDNLLHGVTLRVSEATSKRQILHIPEVLCHRTRASDWNGQEARDIVAAHLARQDAVIADISPAPLAPQWNRVRFTLPKSPPLVSLIVPTRDRADLIGPCADGILNHTDYPSLELIIVDNGTTAKDALAILGKLESDPRVQVLRDDRPFNYSRLNNGAAALAKGDILVLMNNDIEIIHEDWLKELASLASQPDIGVVGAKLLYPDMRVQHAGLSFGPNKLALHQMRRVQRHETGPHGELSLLRSVSAVTGACLALRRNLYLEAGGLNETQLPVTFNDIDLCRRIAKQGLAIVCTPFAELIHHETVTRDLPTAPESADREISEQMAFWAMNPDFYEYPDPFHNPQIEFKYECVDFARPPRWHPLRGPFKEEEALAFLY